MKKEKEKSAPAFDKELCWACAMCVDRCPTGAIDLEIANSIHGFRPYPRLTSPEKCIDCGACAEECPSGAVTMKVLEKRAAA